MLKAAPALGATAGLAAAALHFAGALKSTPALASLPFDVTLLAAVILLPALLLLIVLARRWDLAPQLALPLAGCAGLWLWWVLRAAGSSWPDGAAERLRDIVLIGPVMLFAGMAIGADPAARRIFVQATIAIGIFVGASVAWGIATDRVALGGQVGADPARVRVQYQIAGLAIACAAGLVSARIPGSRGLGRVGWLALLALLAGAVLLPGGRAALLALGVTAGLVPALVWVLEGRLGSALLWLAGLAAAGGLALAMLALDPERVAELATLERLLRDDGGVDSAREILWSAAWGLGDLAGLGPGGFPPAAGNGQGRALHPHNHAIEALVEGGAVGLLLWLLAFGGGALVLLRRLSHAGPRRAAEVLALTLPMAMTAMVSTDLGNRMAWFALGLALSAAVEARRV
ncbi:O-antigen ligase family protein [Roseococcus sp. YIM B11640]|uniref:O-antigen ligase family protein n=1 Tax=Roseococcus sp. YIM B11640 TaxID=3133973 RepID=UPI003C7AB3DD